MSSLTILQAYAQKSPPEFPSSILFSHTSTSITIYDGFPKSIFHFLVLPRIIEPYNGTDLSSLRSFLRHDKAHARELILALREDARMVAKEIEAEMMKRYGFKWEIWMGFHAVPSMKHLHLHVLSGDLCSPKLKNKKHYNSFHPKLGFFLDIDEVLSWFDAEPSYFASMSKLEPKTYEPILKEDLACWRCGSRMKNMPTLKAHLQEEWDRQANLEKAKMDRTRKLEEKRVAVKSENNTEGEQAKKRRLEA
ncbi:HIT-like protein [Tricholoma matsutake]|nr:HIT-like protein [Tricholoma matsutake 945]